MRDLSIVITRLLEVIPDSQDSLHRKLISAQINLNYAAPKTYHYHWSIVAWILEANTLDRNEDWVKMTQHIFNNETIPS